MGTRYVWDRYSTVDLPSGIFEQKTTRARGSESATRFSGYPSSFKIGCTSTPTGPDDNGYYTPAGQIHNDQRLGIKQVDYNYFMINDSTANKRRYYYETGNSGGQWSQNPIATGNPDGYISLTEIASVEVQQHYSMNIVEAIEGTIKGAGTVQGQNTSSLSSTYPNDALSGSYWYKYKGSDSIDPTGVSYSITKPEGGKVITVTVTPRGNIYGGTIYYQFSYSTNGGASWTDSGSKVTNTSKSFTLARGSKQFSVRVIASDNYGFISTDYIIGANLTVTNTNVYIGIDSRARKIKNVYIGIDGTARKVAHGYIGDASNKARLWF